MPSQSSSSRSAKIGLSGFSLFVIFVLVAGIVAYLIIQTNKARNGAAMTAGSAELAPSTQPNALARLFGKKPAAVEATPTPEIKVAPTMAPRPLPKGVQEYSIQLGDGFIGPKFVKGVVSDYTTIKNSKQTVAIYINNATPATSVTGSLVTDTKQTALNFSLIGVEGNLQKWQADWTLADDTFNKNYSFTFSATGVSGQSKTAIGER